MYVFYSLMYAQLILLSVLAKFLYDNYKQALDIIRECEVTLPALMKEHDIADEQVFEAWLMEEKTYLQQLSDEPLEETLQMEYWEQLVKLTTSRYVLRFRWSKTDLQVCLVGKNSTLRETPGSHSQVKTMPQWTPALQGGKRLSDGMPSKITRKT